MITKAKQPDGLWRYYCGECGTIRFVKYSDLRNPCRCPIQEIEEVSYNHRTHLSPPGPRRIEPKRTGQAANGERATPNRVNRRDCIHIDGSTGETTKHLCGGCPGGQVATIFQCELFGDCLPAAWAPTPESTARRCADCLKYVKESPPSPLGE